MLKNTSQTTKWAIGSAALVVVILLYVLWANPSTPPADFLEARIAAVGAVNNLAQLVDNSLANLEKVDTFTKNENDIEAQNLIGFEFQQRAEKQNAALRLALQLDQMAKTAPSIRSSRARTYAVQSITSGVAMVSRIISYNNNLDQLFTAIQQKIQYKNQPNPTNIRALSANLNADAKAINGLSKEFNDALAQFDKEYGIK